MYNLIHNHHSIHFFTGFIGDPAGQFQILENSGELERLPITLNLLGLWTSDKLSMSWVGVEAAHHTCKTFKFFKFLCFKR